MNTVELVRIHEDALAYVTAAVYGVSEDAWDDWSPCDDWTVRDVLNHLVSESLWSEPLTKGRTVEEVGDEHDGDLLGDDPLTAWDNASKTASGSFARENVTENTVHVSWGDISGLQYLQQMTLDLVIHGWDVLVGSGQDDEIPEELVSTAMEIAKPLIESGQTGGVFKGPIEVDEEEDDQTKLLALVGRERWTDEEESDDDETDA